METSVIVSLILGGSSIISSVFFGLIPMIRRNKLARLEDKNYQLLNDIKLFYEIEAELLERLQGSTNVSKETLKKEIRKKVSENNDGRVLSYNSKPSVYTETLNNYNK